MIAGFLEVCQNPIPFRLWNGWVTGYTIGTGVDGYSLFLSTVVILKTQLKESEQREDERRQVCCVNILYWINNLLC